MEQRQPPDGAAFWIFFLIFLCKSFSRNICKRFFYFGEKSFLQNILQKFFVLFFCKNFTEHSFIKLFSETFFILDAKHFPSKFFIFSQDLIFQIFSHQSFPFSPNISLKNLPKNFLAQNDKYFSENRMNWMDAYLLK